MKISGAKVIVTCPGAELRDVQDRNRSRLYGIGNATLNGRELSVAYYLENHAISTLIGRENWWPFDAWHSSPPRR